MELTPEDEEREHCKQVAESLYDHWAHYPSYDPEIAADALYMERLVARAEGVRIGRAQVHEELRQEIARQLAHMRGEDV